MVATFRTIDGKGDLPTEVQKAMGLGARVPMREPLLSFVLPNGDSVTIQADGQLAIFRPVGFEYKLYCCECSGEIVNEIPRMAEFVIAYHFGQYVNRLYRYRGQYFSYANNTYIHFRPYNIVSPIEGKKEDETTEDDTVGCNLWHTNDNSLNDYYRDIDKSREESPLPATTEDDKLSDPNAQLKTENSAIVSEQKPDVDLCAVMHARPPYTLPEHDRVKLDEDRSEEQKEEGRKRREGE